MEFKGNRAFSTLGCGDLKLSEVMTLAQRHAVPCVELRALGGSVDLPAYLASRYGDPAQFSRVVKTMPARIVALGTSLSLVGNSAQCREAFLAYVPWAEACGASTLRVFDGGKQAGAEEISQARSTLLWWQHLRAEKDWRVDIAVETHDAFASEDNLRRLLKCLPEVNLLWDAHHTWRKGGADPLGTWELVRERVRHIHIKDSVADPGVPAGYSYVLPGTGEFPMPDLRQVLCRDRYSGVLSLEWERHWHA
uniref:sugar phosphate isomerase/epimerase family protein n=1 Tax=Cupriavidus necator TaxID=106590 RepID=UPI003F499E10